MIPYGKQCVAKSDIRAVVKTLRSDWITQGPAVAAFEANLAKKVGARYAVAVSTGTAALHLACLALGVRKGSDVITSPITFLATSNSVLYCGGRPVFADVDPETVNLDPARIPRAVTRRTIGIIPVHFAGHPCDMKAIAAIARRRKLFVLEDACHALGAEYRSGRKRIPVGSCAHSDACIFSFHPVKAITTGEGGAITTNRKDVYHRLLTLRNHGMTREARLFENKDLAFWREDGKLEKCEWYYEMQELGFNYRLTDIQSSLGISQLSRLEQMIARRREIAARYDAALADLPVRLPAENKGFRSAYHLYVLRLDLKRLRVSRAGVFARMREAGLGVQVHYIPVHRQPYYRKFGYAPDDFPVAESYYEGALSIPIYPSMKEVDIRRVIRTVRGVLEKVSR